MVKSIIKRIIVGVGIALVLMCLKGGLIADVHAEGIYSWETNNNANFGSCSSCHGIDYTQRMFTYDVLKGKSGYLYLNFAFYSTTSNMEFLPVSPVVRVYSGNNTFNCTIYGTSDHNRVLNNNTEMTTASYSAICPVYITNDGTGIKKVSIYVLGASSSGVGISFYSPATFVVSEGSEITQAIEENTQAQEETNDTLKSEDAPDTEGLFSDIDTNDSNSPVSDLITMPITLLQAINNNSSGTCTTWNLGTLLGKNLTMPCINLQNILGSSLYNIIDMAICLFLAYNLGLMCVSIYNNLTSLNDDFDSMYAPKHEEHGKHGRVE